MITSARCINGERLPWLRLYIIVGTVAIASFVMTPVYRATVRILIEREAPKVLTMQELLPVDASSTEFYQTQYKILQSRSLALRVIQALNLSENPVFNPAGSDDRPVMEKREKESMLVGKFLKSLRIDPIRNSRLVDISFDSTDRALAADIANMVAKGFIDQNVGWKSETSSEAKDFLTKQIEEQKKTLEESEQALQKYKEQYGIVQLTPFGGRQGEREYRHAETGRTDGEACRRADEKGRGGSPLQGGAGSARERGELWNRSRRSWTITSSRGSRRTKRGS